MLLGIDNPDYYDTATLPRYWWTEKYESPEGTPAVRADGYGGAAALTAEDGAWTSVQQMPVRPAVHPIAASQSGGWLGARYLFEAYPDDPVMLFAMLAQDFSVQVSVSLNPDGSLSIWRGPMTTELATSNTILPLDTFHRLWFKANVNSASGFAEVGLNRTVIRRFSGNTRQDAGATLQGFLFGLPSDCAASHLYWGDIAGFQPEPLPALLVRNQFPASDGTLQDWIPTGAGTMAEAIDDTVPDDDATRIDSALVGDAFTVHVDTLADAPLIYAVQSTVMIKKASEDTNEAFRFLTMRNGIVGEGQDAGFTTDPPGLIRDWDLIATYEGRRSIYHITPVDFQAWTVANFNATQFGGRAL
jgi:hypothetical protein